MKRILLAVFALGLTVMLSSAQDNAIDIKVGRKKAGDSARITVSKKSKVDVTVGDNKKVERGTEKAVYIETIVDKPDDKKKATKSTRKYESLEVTKGGKPLDLSYAKGTVTIEKKDDEYRFTMNGKALPDEEAATLKKEFGDDSDNMEEDLLPGKPVKIGDEWKINAAHAFAKKRDDNPFTVDENKATGTAKLVKTSMKDGHRYGVIEISAKLPVKSMKLGDTSVATNDGSQLKVKMTLDVPIDGSTPYGKAIAKIDIDITLDVPNVGSLVIQGGEEAEMNAEKVK